MQLRVELWSLSFMVCLQTFHYPTRQQYQCKGVWAFPPAYVQQFAMPVLGEGVSPQYFHDLGHCFLFDYQSRQLTDIPIKPSSGLKGSTKCYTYLLEGTTKTHSLQVTPTIQLCLLSSIPRMKSAPFKEVKTTPWEPCGSWEQPARKWIQKEKQPIANHCSQLSA